MHRRALLPLLAVAFVIAPAGPADAVLRSPHLESSCPAGYAYGEHSFGPWRVEGCSQERELEEGETARRRFEGDVEVNGMIVESDTKPLVATTRRDGDDRIHRILRKNARLVVDPKIGGSRRRFTIFSGQVDLEIALPASGNEIGPQTPPERPPGAQPLANRAATQATTGTVNLPVSGTPSVLGLRIRDQIEGAKVSNGGVDPDGASIEFKPPMTLGSAASALLKDWQGKITLKTVDGTGMKVDDLLFKVPNIEIPGIGGFEHLSIRYSDDDDEWSGTIRLDLGETLFTLDLAMSVSASTGAPTRIAGQVDNLNIPIGNTGIFLQRVNALFDPNPLFMGVGAGATAGPAFGGLSLIEMNGNLDLQLEDSHYQPHFRLEAGGDARVFPTSATNELANGGMSILIDEDGFISIAGTARYELAFEDPLTKEKLGISADIGGSGAYSTTSDKFNIEAHATGTLLLDFLGRWDVAQFGAVVSDTGWGTCGNLPGLLFFVKAGIGQRWDRNPELILGCDLSPFSSTVPGASVAQAPGRFRVRRGVKRLGVRATADGPSPQLELVAPNGRVAARSVPLGRRTAGKRVAVIAQPGSSTQYFFVRDPRPGGWRVRSTGSGPGLRRVQVARDTARLRARGISVRRVKGRPGRRRLRVRGLRGIYPGERVAIGIRRRRGQIQPLGSTRRSTFTASFDELRGGRRAILATVVRGGVPIPGRSRVIGRYRAKMPPRPRSVSARRKGRRITALARARRRAERPRRWQYVLRAGRRVLALKRGKPGRRVRFTASRRLRRLTVSVRPVVHGRTLRGKAKRARVKKARKRKARRRRQ